MSSSKDIKQSRLGMIIAAAAVFIAAINLVVSSFSEKSVYLWTALTLLFSTLTILFVNLSAYRKRVKQAAQAGAEK